MGIKARGDDSHWILKLIVYVMLAMALFVAGSIIVELIFDLINRIIW